MASSEIKTNLSETNNRNKDQKESEVAILSILEKSYNNNILKDNYEIPNHLLNKEKKENGSNNNITLFNALYNSLINKDHKSFLFCIEQKNEILIEETVKQMNNDCLGKFLEKSVDIFQSNSFFIKFLIPWIQTIFKFKKIELLSKNNIENLSKLQEYIKDKIKCFNNLCIIKEKMNKINDTFNVYPNKKSENFLKKEKNQNEKEYLNDNKPIIFEPLLTYYESEDEGETEKNKIKKKKMEVIGFEEIEKDNNEEDEEMEEENEKEESDEDNFDEEISNMDIDSENDKIKNKKKINKDIINIDEEEKEEDIEEDDDDE